MAASVELIILQRPEGQAQLYTLCLQSRQLAAEEISVHRPAIQTRKQPFQAISIQPSVCADLPCL